MGTEQEKVKKELIYNEEKLLENSIRNDASRISEYIDDMCVEFTAAGKQRIYKPGELFGSADGELYIDSSSVRMVDLSDDCKLLLYVAGKVMKNQRVKSNRSSIWKKADGKWKMIFHQGTNCSE